MVICLAITSRDQIVNMNDVYKFYGKDKGIIIHSYVFGSYFLVELIQDDERTGMTQIVHWNEIKKCCEK